MKKRCEFLEFSCCVSACFCLKNASSKGVHSEPHRQSIVHLGHFVQIACTVSRNINIMLYK